MACAANETTVCQGGKAGLGFQGYSHGWIEFFLSTGSEQVTRSEYYKKSPELARIFTDTIPRVKAGKWLVFKPLALVEENEKQTEAIAGKIKESLNGKLNGVLGVSIAALLVAAADIVLHVLSVLHIF